MKVNQDELSDRGFERGFFRERHTIPGSLFLLLVIVLNWPKIAEVLRDNYLFLKIDLVSGFALALFGVFGLTITGFFLSQIWFLIFWIMRLIGFEIFGPMNPAHVFLRDHGIRSDINRLQVISDYFGITSNEKVSAYLSRRLDLMHILGSSIISVCGAIIITVKIGSYIEPAVFGLLCLLVLGIIISSIRIRKENYYMVDYIIRLKYKKQDEFWDNIPNEYNEKLIT